MDQYSLLRQRQEEEYEDYLTAQNNYNNSNESNRAWLKIEMEHNRQAVQQISDEISKL